MAQPNGVCRNVGVGTSYAAPVVTGVIALMLEANPALTWRDVQGILATTASQTNPTDASWVTNGAGLTHSGKYGFGLVDAHAAVRAAVAWQNYPSEQLLRETRGGGGERGRNCNKKKAEVLHRGGEGLPPLHPANLHPPDPQ